MLEVDKRKSETKKIKPNTETLRFNMKKPSDVKGKNTGSGLSLPTTGLRFARQHDHLHKIWTRIQQIKRSAQTT
jgi:hypothetical protein